MTTSLWNDAHPRDVTKTEASVTSNLQVLNINSPFEAMFTEMEEYIS